MCKWLSKATACYKQTGLFLALVFLFYGTEAKFGGGGFGRGGGGFFGRGGGGTRGGGYGWSSSVAKPKIPSGIGRSSGGVIYGGGYVGQSAPKRMPSGTSGGVIYSGGNVGQRVKAPPNIPRNSGNYHYPSNKGNMGSMNRKPIGAKPSIHHHHYHHYYSSQGIGSRPRSDQFKDMLVGAAAGHLIYKAGQSIINRPSDPFIWSGRPYYWTAYPVFINNNGGAGNGGYHTEGWNQGPAGPGVGSEAARGSSSTDLFGKILCSMPLQNDPKFEKIRFDNGTQPKEIVWHCRYNEMCCGSECCASNTTKLGTAGLLVSNGVYFNGVHLPSLTAMVLMWLALIFN